MNISKEAIEAAARAAYMADNAEWEGAGEAWDDMGGSEPCLERALREISARAALEAAAPLLMAQAWDEGRAHGAIWPYGYRGLGADDNPYRKETP